MGLIQNHEAIEMARRASDEIKSLRKRIDELAPKAEAYETLRTVLGLLPRPPQGWSEDVAYMLDKRVREAAAAMEAAKGEKTNGQ